MPAEIFFPQTLARVRDDTGVAKDKFPIQTAYNTSVLKHKISLNKKKKKKSLVHFLTQWKQHIFLH